MHDAGKALMQSDLDPKLLNLVLMRASQLNRCAFCLALHMREGKALGDTDDRLFGVAGWREASWYDARERVALEWTEALTQVSLQPPSDDLRARVREQFTEREIVYLTYAIGLINSFNRANVAFGTSPDGAEAVFKALRGPK